MIVILRRHGKTKGNLLKQYIGITDEEVSEEGLREIKLIPTNKNVTKVYTSSLKRTIETAKILYPNAKIIQNSGLNEMNFGIFEKKSYKDLEKNEEYKKWLETNCESKCPKGESKKEFVKRVLKSFQEIIEKEKLEKNLYFIVHGGTVMALLSELVIPRKEYFDSNIKHLESIVLKSSKNMIEWIIEK